MQLVNIFDFTHGPPTPEDLNGMEQDTTPTQMVVARASSLSSSTRFRWAYSTSFVRIGRGGGAPCPPSAGHWLCHSPSLSSFSLRAHPLRLGAVPSVHLHVTTGGQKFFPRMSRPSPLGRVGLSSFKPPAHRCPSDPPGSGHLSVARIWDSVVGPWALKSPAMMHSMSS